MIHFCFITDNNYVLPTINCIKSIISHKKIDTLCKFNIICNNVEHNNIIKLNEVAAVFELDNLLEKVIKKHHYVSKCAVLKFNIPSIFKDLDRILYIDSDMLVKKDLTDLWDVNIDNKYAAVVRDLPGEVTLKYHIRIGNKYYFNSGLMLLNLKRIREDDIENKLIEYKKHYKTESMDQDSFNIIFGDNVINLSCKYNFMITNLRSPLSAINKMYKTQYKTYNDALSDANIIHFTYLPKPWIKKLNIQIFIIQYAMHKLLYLYF